MDREACASAWSNRHAATNDAWNSGQARAVTQMDYGMRDQMTACSDRLDDSHCEDLGLPPDSTVGEAASEILELLAEWSSELEVDTEEELVPIAKKLGHLLGIGKHEYLKELIDELHATLSSSSHRTKLNGVS
jgi:hypothetical protein